MSGSGRRISRPMKVLVVNDDERELLDLVATIEAASTPDELELSSIASASEAIRLFKQGFLDLVIIGTDDINRLGRELIGRVRASEGNRHTGIIIVDRRSKDDSALSVECLELGADDYIRKDTPASELLARVRAVLRLKAMTDELRTANHRLRVLSLTDELTGLANMRSFNQKIGELFRRCRRGKSPIGTIMMDLDHFKSVNDTTNHLVGSYVLSEVGRLIRQHNFVPDAEGVAARYGGDEFVLALEAKTLDELTAKAEEIRRVIEATTFERDGCKIQVTASLGVAWVAGGFLGRAEDLIKAADLMLYRSKNSGRNRVSGMELKYPVDLSHDNAARLAERQGRHGVSIKAKPSIKLKA